MDDFTVDKLKLKKIIIEGDAKELNNYAELLGKMFTEELQYKDERGKIKKEKELSTSQIRNILDEIQRMTTYDANRLQLIRPKLAYAAGRHKGRLKQFREIIESAIPLISDNKKFVNFKNFIEAIVAYHRYHGGKE